MTVPISIPVPLLQAIGIPLPLATATALLENAFHPMALFGWLGQALFFSRFLVQWLVSERQGRSTVPLAFWHLSLSGGALFLIYAIWRQDLVLMLGQATGLAVYGRNLFLIGRARRAGATRA